jgi:hypothetical protein
MQWSPMSNGNGSGSTAGYGTWGDCGMNIEDYQPMADTTDVNSSSGFAVSISGDYAVIGQPINQVNGIYGGSASIYFLNGGQWELQTILSNSSQDALDYFGYSVHIDGDYLIVGAPFDDENGFTDNGSASVFKRNGSTWNLQSKFTNINTQYDDLFGYSVSLMGDYAVIGAPYDDETDIVTMARLLFL